MPKTAVPVSLTDKTPGLSPLDTLDLGQSWSGPASPDRAAGR
jgi:hypothetical protein